MALNVEDGPWDKFDNDVDAILRLQNILLQAAEGTRGGEIDLEYQALRKALTSEGRYAELIPSFLKTNRDLDSIWAFFKSFAGQWEPRRKLVRESLAPVLDLAEQPISNFNIHLSNPKSAEIQAATWTGAATASSRMYAVRTYVPVALAAIDSLIDSLESPKSNGGPQLDEHVAALENLRLLHAALGNLLEAADDGHLFEDAHDGLAVEIAQYAKRAARELKNDPIKYLVSGLILSTLSAAGVHGLAAYMAGIALNIKKQSGKKID